MRILAHLRKLDESRKDWERYQNISLEDLKNDLQTLKSFSQEAKKLLKNENSDGRPS